MAEIAPPRHPAPTPSDANNYAPYAVLAIVALVVSALYAVVLLVLAVAAYRNSQPFIQPVILVLPAAGVVLAFAARRQIRNSEGTRAGMPLVNAAWWLAVAGGVGYAAYLITYQLGVYQNARESFRGWAKNLDEVDLNDPKNAAFFYVFDGTIDPEKQGRMKLGQANLLYTQLKQQYLAARQSFLVRLANRNRGELKIDVGGLDNWEQDNSGQKCNLAVVVRCPEGEYACNVPMLAKRVDGQWKWSVGLTPTGNLTSARVTRYGRLVNDAIAEGYSVANSSFLPALQVQGEGPAVLSLFTGPGPYPAAGWAEGQVAGRMGLLGAAGREYPTPKDYDDRIAKLFEPVDKGDPAREAEQRRAFVATWRNGRIVPPGRVMSANPEQHPTLTVLKDALELKVPVELQTQAGEGSRSAARGAVVLRIDDPAFLAKMNELRAASGGDSLEDLGNAPPAPGAFPWRLSRIESDMKTVAPEAANMAGPRGGQ